MTEWFHVVAVSETGVGTRLHINGVQESTGPLPNLAVSLAASPNLFIGANPGAGGREWNGEIAAAAIWNRALTPEEVTEIYGAGGGTGSLGELLGLTGGCDITITAYTYNPAIKQVAMTWTSAPGVEYAINYSTGLVDWTGVAVATVPGTAAATTTTSTFPVPAAVTNAGRMFFRVKTK